MLLINAITVLLIGHSHAITANDVPTKLPAVVRVSLNQRHQTIDGFGFSQAFQRAAWLHGKLGLAPEHQKEVLDLLFDREKGAGATILRNGIGSSTSYDRDFMKSIAPTSPGSPDAEPAYAWDGYDADQVWLTKTALAYGGGPKYVYADAWSAPGYMKTNGNDSNGGHLLCGSSSSSSSPSCGGGEDWRKAYARYLAQFLRFYREREGIEITHLGWLNEPDLNQTYASMLSDGFQAADFARILRQTLRDEGFGYVRLVCCEATGWTQGAAILAEFQTTITEAEGDEAALLDVYAAHAYSADAQTPLKTTIPKVWQTEWADLDGSWNPAWDNLGKAGEGIGWANKIQESLVLGNVSAWLYWIGAEPTPTNSALIQLPLQNNNGSGAAAYSVSGRFWAFAQFSRFVRPGAVRVDAEADRGFLGTSAFFLDGEGVEGLNRTIIVQMINNGHVDLDVQVVAEGAGGAGYDDNISPEIWLTNTDNNLTRIASSSGDSVLVPKRSMVTLIL
ncbi:glycoside hydrolase [Apiospora arundinis]|uniref:Glycoside hydrolase n=1 Tax=Apiospora arundinis TaxID=335852 RepID=A0ABR2IF00_9PEZI